MRYLLLFTLLLTGLIVHSQASVTFVLPDVAADNNSEACLPVTVEDFTAGLDFSFALRVDPNGALFDPTIRNITSLLPNFNASNFDTDTYAAEGLVLVNWQSYPEGQACNEGNRQNLEDGTVLFEVCYQVSGPVATQHDVEFFGKPDDDPSDGVDDSVPISFRKDCNPSVTAFPGERSGSVTIGVRPLELNIETTEGIYRPGDTYCIDIVAEAGFDDLKGYQFGVNYDPTVLRATSADANEELAFNSDGGYNIRNGGASVYAIWNIVDNNAVSLPDGTRLVTLCFEVIGDCGSRTDIAIGPDDRGAPVEANGPSDALATLPVVTGSARLIVDNCNSAGFDVVLGCPGTQVQYNQEVCIEVQAGDDFEQMTDIQYQIKWDPNILRFERVQNPADRSFININDDFDVDRTDDGFLFFDWNYSTASGFSLPEGAAMYEVCFTTVGFGGTTPLLVTDSQNEIRSAAMSGFFRGVNPSNCSVTVQQPEGVAIRFPESSGFREGVTDCIDVDVDGFVNVESMQLFLITPSDLEYVSFTSPIAGLNVTSGGTGLVIATYSGAPFTIPDGQMLLNLCLRAVAGAEPDNDGDCGIFDVLEATTSIRTTESAGSNVSIETFTGEGCVLFPNGYGVVISDAVGPVDSTVCVPVSVTQFDMITGTNIRFAFDPSALTYSQIKLSGPWTGLSQSDFDLSSAATGIIDLSWSTTAGGGLSIPGDTTQVFEICFETSLVEDCVFINSSNQTGGIEAVTTANGEPGSVVHDRAEICLEDRLVIEDLFLIQASCEGEDDGGIFFKLAPRANNEDVFIRVDNPTRNGFVGDTLRGLLPGVVNYTLYNARGTLSTSGTATITVNQDNAALANAGDDSSLSCSDNAVANIGGRGNIGETWNLFFVLADGNTRAVDNGTVAQNDGNVFAQVSDPGTYILEVVSQAGCTDRDTVVIASVGLPEAVASQGLAIDCSGDGTVLLSGEGSSDETSAGTTVTYVWERLTGSGEVLEQVGTSRDIVVSDAGRYRLTVAFPQLGCDNSTITTVRDDQDFPDSRLPNTISLNCDGSDVTLSIGPPETGVDYTWFQLGSSTPLTMGSSYDTDQIGTYEVLLSNQTTGCSVRDTIEVLPSQGAPTITLPASISLNCDPDSTVIPASYANTDVNTRYSWSGSDGAVVLVSQISSPTPTVFLPGTYKVVVSNGECKDSTTIQVTAPALPDVNAGPDQELPCGTTLNLTGTSTDEVTYQWSRNGIDLPMGMAASVAVDQPGDYALMVTSLVTGCTNTDSITLNAPAGFPVFTLADTIGGLGCDPSSVTLTVDVAAGADYSYLWTDPNGVTISNMDTAEVSAAGLYTLMVTNNATSCVSTEQVRVIADNARLPFINLPFGDQLITCETSAITIDASSSSQGPNFDYIWSSSEGGETPATQGMPTLTVSTPGLYSLTVRNTDSGCESSGSVRVNEERELPNVEALPIPELDCDVREAVIGIQINDQPNEYSINWIGPGGTTDLPDDTTRILIEQGGTYNAIVINDQTSCVSTVVLRVPDLADSIATISVLPIDSLDCSVTSVTIDASGSTLASPSSTIEWTALGGGTVTPATGSLVVSVDDAGDYALTISDGSGCSVSDTITVIATNDSPMADAGAPLEVECGEMPMLDGTGSSEGDYVYEWTVIAGDGSIASGGNTLTPVVTGPGTYQLSVSTPDGSCSDLSTVDVSIADQAAAQLPADFNTCDSTIIVTGNLPPGTSGSWTSLNDEGAVFTSEENIATVTVLAEGIDLVYTLSSPICGPYSSDTIRIRPEIAPVANDDELTITGINNVGTVNLLDNDLRSGGVSVRLLQQPAFGEIVVNLNGDLTYESPIGLTAITFIDYEICSNACPDLCSQATLRISSEADGQVEKPFNAFTPNGDGMNETFVFQRLEREPGAFPDNELTVFNRWGDIIFQASPYNNDWDGTTNNGTPIPEGTYYYILRLDIGEGEIIRGDVTIVR